MGAKEVYEKLKREKNQDGSKAKKVYAQMMQSKIIDDYNSIIQYNTDLYNKSKSRYYDDEGNYIDKYRSDSEDWKNTTLSLSGAAREKSKNIRSLLDKYGSYYDSDFVSKITSSLDEHEKYSANVVKGAISQHDYFSNLKTEYDYNSDIMNNTSDLEDGMSAERIEKRATAYKANTSRISELNDLIKNFKFENEGSWEWGMSPDSNVPTPKYTVKAKNQAEYDALVAEKERLENANRKYKSHYKENDDAFLKYQGAEDFAEDSQKRDFNNPTIDDVNRYMAENDTVSWSQDKDGNHVDRFGTVLDVVDGSIIHPNADKYTVNDPLGVYLSDVNQIPLDIPSTINDGDFAREYNKAIIEGMSKGWDKLKEEEIGLYYYLLNNTSKETALAYLDGMENILYERMNEDSIEYLENEATPLELVFHNVASVPASILGGGIAFIDDALNLVSGNDIDPSAHFLQDYAQNTRTAISNDLNEWTNNADFLKMSLGDAYQSAMSGVDSFAGALTLGSGYTVLMAMGAASSKAKELYEKGASNEQIAMGGSLSGAAEYVFEKMSIDYFLNNFINAPTKNVGNWILKSLTQGGIELSEEILKEMHSVEPG